MKTKKQITSEILESRELIFLLQVIVFNGKGGKVGKLFDWAFENQSEYEKLRKGNK